MARKIAVVDDENSIRRLCQDTLQKAGYEVRSYASGAAAIADLTTSPADVVILDIYMPEMDGFECMEQLKQKHPGTLFLFITGYGDESSVNAATVQEKCAMLSKPFNGNELNHAVRCVLNPSKTGRLVLRIMPEIAPGAEFSNMHAFGLTVREGEIMQLLRVNMTDKEIALHLEITPHTVSNHLASIYHKLGCMSRLAAVQKYFGDPKNDGQDNQLAGGQ
jgi:two-component system NarL family response regulator